MLNVVFGNEAIAVTRADLQQLARDRIRDARTLLASGRWSAAYYLAGYAVECGLKACIVARLKQSEEFPEKKFSEQCWTHNLVQLLSVAGFKDQFNEETASDLDLLENWKVVKDWNEASRYERQIKAKAKGLYEPITDKKHGVLSWIKQHW